MRVLGFFLSASPQYGVVPTALCEPSDSKCFALDAKRLLVHC